MNNDHLTAIATHLSLNRTDDFTSETLTEILGETATVLDVYAVVDALTTGDNSHVTETEKVKHGKEILLWSVKDHSERHGKALWSEYLKTAEGSYEQN